MATSTQWQLSRDSAERYETILVPSILGPAARALVDACTIQPGDVVVDIGCGTGAATRFAAERVGPDGRVFAVDVNPGMIDVARSLSSTGAEIDWRVASATALPLETGTANLVLLAQTLQFVPEKGAVLNEARRVLTPGGRVALSLWCELGECPYFHAVAEAVAHHIGEPTAVGLRAISSLASPDEIRPLLISSGFEQIEMHIAQLDLDLPDLTDFVPRHVSATPMAPAFAAVADVTREAIIRDISNRLSPYRTRSGVRVPFRMHVVSAGNRP